MSDFRVLGPRSLPQSVNIAAGNGRLFMANDASFKSDTYSRETHVRKAANTHTHTHTHSPDTGGRDAGRHRGSGFGVEVGRQGALRQRGLMSGGPCAVYHP